MKFHFMVSRRSRGLRFGGAEKWSNRCDALAFASLLLEAQVIRTLSEGGKGEREQIILRNLLFTFATTSMYPEERDLYISIYIYICIYIKVSIIYMYKIPRTMTNILSLKIVHSVYGHIVRTWINSRFLNERTMSNIERVAKNHRTRIILISFFFCFFL